MEAIISSPAIPRCDFFGLIAPQPLTYGIIEAKIKELFDCCVTNNPTTAMQVGLRGFMNAISDHDLYSQHLFGEKAFTIPIWEALSSNSLPHFFPKNTVPLSFKYALAFDQGPRTCMEDAHFIVEQEEYLLSGVFDGHGDKGAVSKLAAGQFPLLFAEHLKKTGDLHYSLKETFLNIHAEIKRLELKGGSTAVISHFCRKNDVLTVATLGDSEAFLLQETENGTLILIPLSCIRNWKTDCDRLASYYHAHYVRTKEAKSFFQRKMVSNWGKTPPEEAKYLRVNSKNISNCLGDLDIEEVTSRDPTIVQVVASKGKLILTCDGLTDFWISHKAYLHQVVQPYWKNLESLAKESVAYSLKMQKEMFSKTKGDNVTVLVIEFDQASMDSSSAEKHSGEVYAIAGEKDEPTHLLELQEASVGHPHVKLDDEGSSSAAN